ncbi:hypothetical protein [Rhizobium rhizogenes]|uniref:Uncharacterized protein n=1 Tax=Rhizobium rhizogenes TaxID=359 RepID=A0AA92H9J9_RHIRH|nr:hypothetical protein [Rhizobium rhizogenes]PVE54960.1 hypothetical protein DC430_06870 [Rhizobium rhizogenes]PVE67515.1 hypothetical protein DC415_05510 [Agrobacterium tumefaciens]PVE77292.1 hypothetical protein DCP16_05510 [Sphingomonas sp. TPD3009]
MTKDTPSTGPAGTTDQWPRWEGPTHQKPRGYMPATDDPETDRDAVGENLKDPEKRNIGDALKTKDNQ